ncbi:MULTISPECIES: hypothetical protein [Serratia]|uniref:hypothetical protein n=1 Tax=Serratia TaxID=613 RepID=UPI00069D92BC|nr:hypothetical protein [Serratia marcescens]MBN5320452.1 hypothetical protein [Serratia marcescens]MDN0026510.1 hypothetical protein [Serratia marcescens]MDU7805516.1 hypothetical protein [Serratia marcescens]RTF12181.1 hypothetical protein D9B84_20225 [Serratia marcescens]CAI1712995.1 Uncharacterised protein [Serratia marcescens]
MTSPNHITAYSPASAGHGVELGRFRLRKGVTEEKMYAAYCQMVQHHLSAQPGWLHQYLLKLDGDVFVDVAIAESYAQSQAICTSWHGQSHCESFLSLIEPESMHFGTLMCVPLVIR